MKKKLIAAILTGAIIPDGVHFVMALVKPFSNTMTTWK